MICLFQTWVIFNFHVSFRGDVVESWRNDFYVVGCLSNPSLVAGHCHAQRELKGQETAEF